MIVQEVLTHRATSTVLLTSHDEMGISLHRLSWPWTHTVTQAGFELASFCGSAYRVDRTLSLVNIYFLPLQLLYIYAVFIL